ncbi:hypothetical protein NUH87_10785 [Pseudomonas batumici]|uniref:hypothetical protein n=1 Tax=Pseudomonas batumici TaxID=226910 RepID=UPI0030D57368
MVSISNVSINASSAAHAPVPLNSAPSSTETGKDGKAETGRSTGVKVNLSSAGINASKAEQAQAASSEPDHIKQLRKQIERLQKQIAEKQAQLQALQANKNMSPEQKAQQLSALNGELSTLTGALATMNGALISALKKQTKG